MLDSGPPLQAPEFSQAATVPRLHRLRTHRPALDGTTRHSAGTGSLRSSQSLGYHCCSSCRGWAPSSRYAAALSAVGHARHWPTSRSRRCVHSGPAMPLIPFFSAKYIHHSSQGSQSSVRALNSTDKEYIILRCSVGFLVSGPRRRCYATGEACSLNQPPCPRPSGPSVLLTVCMAGKSKTNAWTEHLQCFRFQKYPGQARQMTHQPLQSQITQQDIWNATCS